MRFLATISVFIVLAVTLWVVVLGQEPSQGVTTNLATSSQAASVGETNPNTPTTTTVASLSIDTSTSTDPVPTTPPKKVANQPKKDSTVQSAPPAPPVAQAVRAAPAYATPAESFEKIDQVTRAAQVNILCMPKNGSLRPVSGSGVFIDSRGVILTNAHVAQYVLLSQSPLVDLTCTIRAGSPATPKWKAVVLYIPPKWVNEHYFELNGDQVVGTGEHDYALLLVLKDIQGNPITEPFPYLLPETRENVAFLEDPVLVGGYPAEFVGGIVAQQNLYAVNSLSSIKRLLTFSSSTVDVFSVGGIIGAQGGASGGPVVNAWRRVVAIITTTSEGATTAQRDLHGLSLNYIDRDLTEQTSKGLAAILSADVYRLAIEFSRETAPGLLQKYIDHLSH